MALEPHALFALGLTFFALVLFSRDRIPLEYSCTAILIVTVVVFEVFPVAGTRGSTFLQGFGNEALITICLLLVLAKGIKVSGSLVPVARLLTRVWLGNRQLALLATLVLTAFISAFTNNTPIVVMLLPILVGVAHRADVSPSKMLMPVGYATIIGGMSTTIGTSTNLLVVSVSEELGMQRIGMFDFTLPAVIAAAFGILYLWLLAPRLLPELPSLLAGSAPRLFNAVVVIAGDSPFVGQTFGTVKRQLGEAVRIERIERGKSQQLVRLPTLKLNVG
ncbi:MAG: SLC13 family permease, partial [Gammaproteobacteria bacterium]|nr:SLC13 family permease [Gammaproteobacteria bacterium]